MRYVLYARKSTESEERQALSIEAQIAELRELAGREQLEIVASFEEARTAREPQAERRLELPSQGERAAVASEKRLARTRARRPIFRMVAQAGIPVRWQAGNR